MVHVSIKKSDGSIITCQSFSIENIENSEIVFNTVKSNTEIIGYAENDFDIISMTDEEYASFRKSQ